MGAGKIRRPTGLADEVAGGMWNCWIAVLTLHGMVKADVSATSDIHRVSQPGFHGAQT